jgi:diguanylate cyclase (GGDEF)-like protein/PAS domain S-box-containing protein
MFDGVGFGIMLVDAQSRQILEINARALSMLELRKEDVVGRICHKFVCPAEQGKCPVMDLGKTVDRSERMLCRYNGTCVPVVKSVVPIDLAGRTVLLESLVDISEQKAAQEALRISEQRYAMAAQGANDGLWDWDLTVHEVYYSNRWKGMLGHDEQEVGSSADEWFRRVHPDDLLRVKTDLDRHLQGVTSHLETEARMRHKDGSYRWMLIRGEAVRDASGTPLRIAGSQTDITERKQVEEELRRGAFYDSLTGLANRALFVDRLERCMTRAQRQTDYMFSVLFLDLDRFKVVNDSLGHQMGDRLLVAVAERLRTCLRSTDTVSMRSEGPHTVARLGGDEFTILLDEISSEEDTVRIAERIRTALSRPFEVDGQEVYTAVSIGIATYDGASTSAQELLRDADTALYRAKAGGRGRYEVFDKTMHTQAVSRLTLERDLRHAVEQEQFVVHFQPIVRLSTGKLTGFEALVRWEHPVRGLISPAEFIPVAEEMGLVVPIGWHVLREATRQVKAWQDHYRCDPPLTVAVNLSSLQIRQADLVERVLEVLKETGLPPTSLELEITESALLQNDGHTLRVLSELKDAGIRLHMDDFGTGYSSLSYLTHFPIDVVKIDRSFITSLDTDAKHAELVNAILTMAQAMGMSVIAEGIESESQLDRLRELSCGYGQGFFFSKPVDAASVEELLRATAPRAWAGGAD